MHHAPYTVVSVVADGVMLYSHAQDAPRVVEEGVSATVVDTLRGVITSGTGEAADIGRPAAGKTGTTQNYGDAWFAGFTPNLTAVVWMGNRDNNETMEGEPTGGGPAGRGLGQLHERRASRACRPRTSPPRPAAWR